MKIGQMLRATVGIDPRIAIPPAFASVSAEEPAPA
jgi:hypothetical protein